MPFPFADEIVGWGPPYVALAALCWGIWKGGRWVGIRLLDKDEGILTGFFAHLRSHLDTQAANHASMVRLMDQNTAAIDSLERRISAAASAHLSGDEMEHLAHLLMEELPVPLAQVDEDGRHLRTNAKFRELLGFSAEELSSMTFETLTPGKGDLAADLESCRQLVTGHLRTFRMEKTISRKDGSSVYVALYCFRFPQVGPFRFFLSCLIPLHPPHCLR